MDKTLLHSSASYADSKPHYPILDGLRGTAALMVVLYHIFEGFATSPADQLFNHGYMAVDFFFILSGFVIGYAYDNRWKKITRNDFFRRRLIRLHPMVIMGTLIGALTFYLQGCVQWDGTPIPFNYVIIGVLCTIFMIPAWPGSIYEIRGNGEMYPLNGPYWSLFFEYIGNILYALFVHRMSTKHLKIMVAILGISLTTYTVSNCSGYGHIGVGWTLADNNFLGGFLRMSFSYTAGLLLSRIFKPLKGIKGSFCICSTILFVLFAVPHIGNETSHWLNGLYDSACIMFVFPFLVYLAASDSSAGKFSVKTSYFLGNLSYPIYTIHYPIMYLFFAWLWKNGITLDKAWPTALCVFFGSILLAYLILKVYDQPVRKYLTRRFIH